MVHTPSPWAMVASLWTCTSSSRPRAAVEWLLGRNRLGVALYDPATGRCADGLDRHGASGNAGGESVACALLGLLALPAPLAVDGAAAPPAATTAT